MKMLMTVWCVMRGFTALKHLWQLKLTASRVFTYCGLFLECKFLRGNTADMKSGFPAEHLNTGLSVWFWKRKLSSAGPSLWFLSAFGFFPATAWKEKSERIQDGLLIAVGVCVYRQKFPMTAREIKPGPRLCEGSGPMPQAADVRGEGSYMSGMCCDWNIFSVYCLSILTSDLLRPRCLWWICNAGSRALAIPDLFGDSTFYCALVLCCVECLCGSNRKCWNAQTGRRSPERSNIRAEGSSGCLDVCEGEMN